MEVLELSDAGSDDLEIINGPSRAPTRSSFGDPRRSSAQLPRTGGSMKRAETSYTSQQQRPLEQLELSSGSDSSSEGEVEILNDALDEESDGGGSAEEGLIVENDTPAFRQILEERRKAKAFTVQPDSLAAKLEDVLTIDLAAHAPRSRPSKRKRVLNEAEERLWRARIDESKVLAEGGVGLNSTWKLKRLVPPRVPNVVNGETETFLKRHDAAFFPYCHFPGLEYLKDVCACISGGQIDLIKLSAKNGSSSNVSFTHVASAIPSAWTRFRGVPDKQHYGDSRADEELFTVAWSCNVLAWPFVPLLAVAGRNRLIYVFKVSLNRDGGIALQLDRTISGHGQAIRCLRFSPSHPHLLISASEDRTVALFDPTIPSGSDDVVRKRLAKELSRGEKDAKDEKARRRHNGVARPLVPGELLGKLVVQGHTGCVLSCDIHPSKPLIVTTASDGDIKIWSIPTTLLGPAWPTNPARFSQSYRHDILREPKLLGPPIFSSSNGHPGQWCDWVRWAGRGGYEILSKAQKDYRLGDDDGEAAPQCVVDPNRKPSPELGMEVDEEVEQKKGKGKKQSSRLCFSTSIRLWRPDVLDTKRHPHPVPSRNNADFQASQRRNGSMAFKVLYEAEVEEQNIIGDKPALLMPTMFSSASLPSPRTLLVMPTIGLRRLFFFSPLPSPPPISNPLELKKIVQRLYPDEESVDTPRLRPIAVSDEWKESKVHWRGLAISPEGGEWIVGVGDGDALAVWRREKAVLCL